MLACCYIHNFLIKKNQDYYLAGSVDLEDTNSRNITPAQWRSEDQLNGLQASRNRNPNALAKNVRQIFCNYFNGVGAVPW